MDRLANTTYGISPSVPYYILNCKGLSSLLHPLRTPAPEQFSPMGACHRVSLQAKGKTAEAEELLPEKVGFQPYATCEVYERQAVAFREYRMAVTRLPTLPAEKTALFYMGLLGHSVGDGASPLHVTVNYNDSVEPSSNEFTVERNTYFKFESQFVHDNLTPANLEAKVHSPSASRDAFGDYLQDLQKSSTLIVSL